MYVERRDVNTTLREGAHYVLHMKTSFAIEPPLKFSHSEDQHASSSLSAQLVADTDQQLCLNLISRIAFGLTQSLPTYSNHVHF